MIKKSFVYSIFTFWTYSFYASASTVNQSPKLFPDLNGNEYRQLLKTQNELVPTLLTVGENKIEIILKIGQRNLEWLDKINSMRNEKIRFSTPENRRTYPVDAPSIYNETIVINNYEALLKELPSVMADILLGKAPYTNDIPVEKEVYVHYALLVDYVYQSAARWKMMKPYIYQLSATRANDIRGYYALSRMENRDNKLSHLNELPTDEQNL